MLRLVFITAGLLLVITASAQQSGVIVYPAKGQSEAQQQKDEGECMSWASQQTGFNPTAPLAQTTAPPPVQQPTASPAKGMFKGALLGAAIGAFDHNAGSGAAIGAGAGLLMGGAARNSQAQASAEQQQAAAQKAAGEYEESQNNFNRAYGVCLQGRGYTVSQ